MGYETLGKLVINKELVFCLVAVVGVLLLMRGITRRIKGKSALTAEEAERRIPSLKEQRDVRDHLQKLMVDLQELARQINGHIDTRFCKLEVLIKEADQKIRQLEKMGFGNGISQLNGGKEVEQADPEREMIHKLADMGKSPVEIAREMNKNTGEIELILSLRRSGNKGGSRIDYRIG